MNGDSGGQGGASGPGWTDDEDVEGWPGRAAQNSMEAPSPLEGQSPLEAQSPYETRSPFETHGPYEAQAPYDSQRPYETRSSFGVADGEESEPANPARLALGVAMLAGDRLRVGLPNDAFVVGVGLAQQTVTEIRGLARRAFGPPSRAANRARDWASERTGVALPNSGLLVRTRSRFGQIVGDARNVGRATIAAGRRDATAFVRASVAEGIAWAETQAVPRIVDNLVPHLVNSVVPRIIDGIMPEIRGTVLPAVVDDLTTDPRIRELVMEQSRGVVGEAAQQVRSATANADDRVEMAFRRLIRGGPEKPEPPPGETRTTPHDG